MEFGQNIFREIDIFDFTRFFAWTFSNFLTCCVLKSETTTNERKKYENQLKHQMKNKKTYQKNQNLVMYMFFSK